MILFTVLTSFAAFLAFTSAPLINAAQSPLVSPISRSLTLHVLFITSLHSASSDAYETAFLLYFPALHSAYSSLAHEAKVAVLEVQPSPIVQKPTNGVIKISGKQSRQYEEHSR